MLRDSVVVVVVVVVVVAVVRTRPQAIPLVTITMRKSTHGFPFVSHMSMGLRLAFGPPELRYNKTLNVLLVFSVTQFKIDQNKK